MYRVVFALALLIAAPALAGEPGPVCRRPEVLQAVAERLQRAGQQLVIDRQSANEIPGGGYDAVRCALRFYTRAYDVNGRPVLLAQAAPFFYTLELRRNGVFVR